MITVLQQATLVVSGERSLSVLRYAVKAASRHRLQNGLPALPDLERLDALLAAGGQPDSTQAPVRQSELITTEEAASILGCSTRTVRRRAPELGGQLINGRWLIDRQSALQEREDV